MKRNTIAHKIMAVFLTFAMVMNNNWPVTMALAAEQQAELAAAAEAAQVEAAPVEEAAPVVEAEPEPEPVAEPEPEAAEDEADDEQEPAAEQAAEPEAQAEDEADNQSEPVAEQAADEAVAEEAEDADEVAYPAATLTDKAGSVTVTIDAPKGALPEGATVKATVVNDSKVEAAVEGAADGNVDDMLAIDVTIYDADGNEVQPLKPVSVRFSNTKLDDGDVSVYHVDDNNNVTEVPTQSATPDTQTFQADGFSIYVVAVTGDEARLNVVFMSGSTKIATIAVKKADTLDTVLYDPGVDVDEGVVFGGWTTNPNYDGTTNGQTIADVRTAVAEQLNAESGVKDGDTVTYYAILLQEYTIDYLDGHGISLGTDAVKFRADSTDEYHSYTVNMGYTPEDDEHAFQGWNIKSGLANIDGAAADALYANGAEIQIKGNVTFSVNAPEGHWLVFHENGGTYIAPQFVKTGEPTAKPTLEMLKNGYRFDGWYTEAGDEFSFKTTISDTTHIYAKWTANATANYTVLIWKQNVAGDGYEFVESVTVENAKVGSTPNVVNAKTGQVAGAAYSGEEGFSFKETNQASVTVAPEGNTVVNVYWDRNEYTLEFQVEQTSGRNTSWSTIYTITARYGTNIRSYFPIVGTNSVNYKGALWQSSGSSVFSDDNYVSYIDTMQAESTTFRLVSNPSNNYTTYHVKYYVEALPGTANG